MATAIWRRGQNTGQQWCDPLPAIISSRKASVAYREQVALLLAMVKMGDVACRSLAQEWLGDKPCLATVTHRECLRKLQRGRAVNCVIGACRVPVSDS